MKKHKAGNAALAAAVVALATFSLAPQMLAVSTTGESLKKDNEAAKLVSDLKSKEISLGELIERMSKLPGIKGIVICGGGTELLVTHVEYSAGKTLSKYPAGCFIRVNDPAVLSIIAEHMPVMKAIKGGEGQYFPV